MARSKRELIDILDRITSKQVLQELSKDEIYELAEAEKEYGAIVEEEIRVVRQHKEEARINRKRVERRWKADEDWGNAQLGLRRGGHMKRGLDVPDGTNDMFCVEYTRKRIAFLQKEMNDAEAHATQGRIAVVVVFQPDLPRERGFAVVRFQDWQDLHIGNKGG